EVRTLDETRRRNAAQLPQLRRKLLALWSARVRRRAFVALRASSALAAVAGAVYLASIALQSNEPPLSSSGTLKEPSTAAPVSLKLDYRLRTEPRR
ncbi:MAG TPA: hypothetical protein VF348_06700, partial [Usitatibacter sp.]